MFKAMTKKAVTSFGIKQTRLADKNHISASSLSSVGLLTSLYKRLTPRKSRKDPLGQICRFSQIIRLQQPNHNLHII